MKILRPYGPQERGSCYRVRGTMEELEQLSVLLSALARPAQREASPHVKSVDVSAVVMEYIQQKRAEELDRIQGSSFVIEPQADLSGTVRVTIRPRQVSTHPAHADCVRQRFITFYQRTASDLQVSSVPVSPHDLRDLQRRFQQLMFKHSDKRDDVIVTGPFVHIAKLREFLLQKTPSVSESPVNKGASNVPGSGQPTHSRDPEEESCPICMESMATAEKTTLRCKHSFCSGCLKQAFSYKPVCPTCGALYGTLRGTQPDGGTMKVTRNSSSVPGYEKYGTIVIQYRIPSGIQKEEHPSPGEPYEGVSRTAYLPHSPEGQRVLGLLRRAFDQRLIFRVGRSTTSGRNNVVTWNDIHHKTSTHGGSTHYGYPDPDYLSRVADELKVKGIEGVTSHRK
uniref:E3 ubiquitin-protein ligase n=2 Tax=Scophthalmus maximus TaxID=52904 RepID=A0A8D2ZDB3_SCOMX